MTKQNWVAAFRHKSIKILLVDKDGKGEDGLLSSKGDPAKSPFWEPISTMMPRQETYTPFYKPYRTAQEVPYFKY